MLKKFSLVVLLILTVAMAGVFGCEKKEENVSKVEHFKGIDFISYEDFSKIQNDENVLIVDARGEKEAKKGTVKNAQAVEWQTFSNMSVKNTEEGFAVLLTKDEMEKALGENGLDQKKEIILIADGANGWGEDGRMFYTLQASGYTNMKILDGGYSFYKESGGETTKELRTPEKVNVKIDEMDFSRTISTKELREKLEEVKIIDTREDDEFNGATKYGETRGGHLPGAKNIPFTNMFNSDGTLKSNKELEEMFNKASIKKEDEVVFYCTSGIRSAYMAIVLENMGYSNAKNYDASINGWNVDDSNPLEK